MTDKYNVTVARTYTNNAGDEKTHWWAVGKAFLGDKGQITLKLWSRTLMVDKLVLWPEENQGAPKPASTRSAENDDDDIPF